MAIAAFKYKMFPTARDLHAFVTTGNVTTVTAIIYDNSGQFVLFYV